MFLMNEIAVFENKQFGEIRTINDNEQIWFVAKDIAEALEYSDASNPARLMQSVPDMWKGVKRIHITSDKPTARPYQDVLCLSEQGVYFFLGRSDKKKALPYQMWIAGVVVPAIRKTGAYSVKPMSQLEIVKYSLDKLLEQEQQIQAIKEEQKNLSVEQASMKTEQASMRTEQAALHDKVDDLETKFESKLNPTIGMDWYTITGYIGLKKYRVSPNDYARLGKMASALSRERDYPMGSAPHPSYGTVHTYHSDILEEVFERYMKLKGV